MDTKRTYTLDDLENLDFPGTPLAVIGSPIEHSLSPAMHNAALNKLRRQDTHFNDWAYYRFEIPEDDLFDALPNFHTRNFIGLNLTVPHKVLALQSLQSVSADAKYMGAVNTLVRVESGYAGYNTDGYGLRRGLEIDLDQSLKGSSVLIIGSGGAARAAAVQALLDGCDQLFIGNRSPARLAGLVEALSALGGDNCVQTFTLDQLPKNLPQTGIAINATSLGLNIADPAPIDVHQLPSNWKVYDMIYNPCSTQFIREAQSCGLLAANGLSMLVHQGAHSLRLWSKKKVDERSMLEAAMEALHHSS
ncbi:MAG: shikimate dehydrogenase [Puniceicoccaceae bacterium MED-G31]|nr:MAG: shikimate dehydrogenase [Puniceicoccaceae bacterium MED-G31]